MKKKTNKKIPVAVAITVTELAAQNTFIGNDLVHLPSFKKSFNPTFIKRAFTQNELNYCQQFGEPLLRYASTWAAKEAIYKALKQAQPQLKIWWKSIEVLRHKPQGKPEVIIHKPVPAFHFSLSITHDGDYVWAVCAIKTVK